MPEASAGPRVVVVAERADGLPPHDAAQAVAGGWAEQAPHVQVEAHASHSGGAGFAEVAARTLGGTVEAVVVPGPRGEEVPAGVALVDGPDGTTAYLDTAQVCGRHLVDEGALLDPGGMTSAGVGPLAPHDGGVGMLTQLGAKEDLADLSAVREDWAGTQLVLATTTQTSLLGFHGASLVLTEEHGVPAEVSQHLETRLGELSDRVARVLPPATDLLTGKARRPEREPGSGTGGGVGYALQLLGARTVSAGRFLLDELGIGDRLPASLLVLVTDSFDEDTAWEGMVVDTAAAALETATPTIVLAREVLVGRRNSIDLGVTGSYAMRPGEDLGGLGARIARTWTPARPQGGVV